jgi:hypothetical protein
MLTGEVAERREDLATHEPVAVDGEHGDRVAGGIVGPDRRMGNPW